MFCFSELQRGDHIVFDRLQGIYCHHAIVTHVDEESGEIKTIEYNCTPSGKFQVMEKTNRFLQEVPVYLMLHGSFDRDLVLWRAQSKIGEEKYSLLPITVNTLLCGVSREDHRATKLTKG